MTRIKHMTNGKAARRLRNIDQATAVSHLIGAARRNRSWFKQAVIQTSLYASRLPDGDAHKYLRAAQIGRDNNAESAAEFVERELHRPASSLNHRTARFAGKPYHWRQDYTGQLVLAAGDSPW